MTHCTSLKLACSPDWMVGRATITIVTSKSNMKVAAHTTTKVHHFFSMTYSLPAPSGVRHWFRDICLFTLSTTIQIHGISHTRSVGPKNHPSPLHRPPRAVQPIVRGSRPVRADHRPPLPAAVRPARDAS